MLAPPILPLVCEAKLAAALLLEAVSDARLTLWPAGGLAWVLALGRLDAPTLPINDLPPVPPQAARPNVRAKAKETRATRVCLGESETTMPPQCKAERLGDIRRKAQLP